MIFKYSRFFIPLIITACCIFVFTACYHDNEEELYADYLSNCEVTSSSFENDVLPIFQVTCYSCHDESNAPINGDGINLDGYTKIKEYETKYPGVIVGAIKHSDGSAAMPKGSKKLDACNINKVEFWILQGMPDN